MIKVKVIKDSDMIKSVSILGHAMYADFGKDIVCASVSTMAITTVNGINVLDESIEFEENSGSLIIRVIKETDINQKLLNNMIDELSELVSQYPKNIEIRNED